MKSLQPLVRGAFTGRFFRFTRYLAIGLLSLSHSRINPLAGGTVTSLTETSSRAVIAGGGAVNFACDGTITLANTTQPCSSVFSMGQPSRLYRIVPVP